MLSAQDAFKTGFLARCVEDGLSTGQMLTRVKQANDLLEKSALIDKLVEKGLSAGTSLVGGVMQYGIPLALATPPILGGVAGYGLAKATDIDDTDIADIKDREVIDEYQRQTDKLSRQRAARAHQQRQKAPPPRPLM